MSESAPKSVPKRKRVTMRPKPGSEFEAAAAAAIKAAAADTAPIVKPNRPSALAAKPEAKPEPPPQVKVWESHDFHSFYPRQPRAIVFADSEMNARCFLDKMLIGRGLKTSREMAYSLTEVAPEKLVYFFP